MSTTIETDFMTVKEAALYLRVSPMLIYQLNARKQIPCRKIGRKIIFSKKELSEWVLSGASKGE